MRYQIGEEPIPGYKYKLESFLGEGSYGEVWKAVGPGGVTCAMKFIRIDSKSGLKELKAISLVKQLRNPNLVPIQAIWLKDPDGNLIGDTQSESVRFQMRANKELIIAMGLGEKSLVDRLNECRGKKGLPDALPGGMPLRELLRFMEDSARGIDYLNEPIHDMGQGPASIVHCDIKPGNLLIVGGGVQVCDYGVARALAVDPGSQAKKTLAAGTPAYAPAELINNDPCPQTDQYSLAMTYYELRTGRLPFDESRALVSNLTGALDLSGLPPGERDVIKQATAMRPADRFPNCLDMVDALRGAAAVTRSRSAVVSVPAAREQPPERPSQSKSAAAMPGIHTGLTDPKIGDTLVAGHRLERPIGNSRGGNLWEARAPGGIQCALKIVRTVGDQAPDLAVLDRATRLSHPNLVQFRGYWVLAANGLEIPLDRAVRGSGLMPHALVITTDLIERNLQNRLNEYRQRGQTGLPVDEVLGYVRQAAAALDYLNLDNNVQHRDVTPENLLLRNDQVLISNFPLARVTGDAVRKSALVGEWMDYAAPEVLDNRVSSRADEFSLAAVYYYLRTGTPPFPPIHDVADGVSARIGSRYDLSGVSPAEAAVLARAMSPNPGDRYGCCAEMIRQVAAAVGMGSGVVAAPAARAGAGSQPFERPKSDPNFQPGSSTNVPWSQAARHAPPPEQHLLTFRPADTPRATPTGHDAPEVDLTPAAPQRPTPRGGVAGTMQFPGGGTEAEPVVHKEKPVAGSSAWKTTPKPDKQPPRPHDVQPDDEYGPEKKSKAGAIAALAMGALMVVALIGTAVYFVTRPDPVVLDNSTREAELVALFDQKFSADDLDGAKAAVDDLQKMNAGKAKELGDKLAARRQSKRADELGKAIEAHLAQAQIPEAERKIDELRAIDPARAAPLEQLLRDLTKKEPNQIDRIASEVEDLSAKGEFEKARPRWKTLEELDKARADEIAKKYPDLRTAAPPDPNPTLYTQLLDQARKEFRARDITAALATLARFQGMNPPTTDAATAKGLKAAWGLANGAKDVAVTNYAQLDEYATKYASLEKLAPLGDKRDETDLIEFARENLAAKIETAYPGFDAKTDWARLARLAKVEAKPTRIVQACLAECWSELTRAGKEPTIDGAKFAPPTDAELTGNAKLDGYFAYAAAMRKAAQGTKEPALAAEAVGSLVPQLPSGTRKVPAWLSPFRINRVWDSFLAALRAALNPNAKLPLEVVHANVVGKIADAGFVQPFATADKDTQGRVAEALKVVGLYLRRTASAWEAFPTLNRKPLETAKDLFQRGHALSGQANFIVWRAICQSELDVPDAGQLEKEKLAALNISKNEPTDVLLQGIIDVTKAEAAPGPRDELQARLAAKGVLASAITGLGKAGDKWAEELAVAYEVAAGNCLAIARLDQTKTEKTAACLTEARGLADKQTALQPDRLEAHLLAATAVEERAWLLNPKLEERFDLKTGYDEADRIYAAQEAGFKENPKFLIGRARNYYKWLSDGYASKKFPIPDAGKLNATEAALNLAIKKVEKDRPALLAEARHWLGQVLALQYMTFSDTNGIKPTYYANALKEYQASIDAAGRPGTRGWARRSAHSQLALHLLEGERAVRVKDADLGKAVAAALEALAKGDARSPLSTLWKIKAHAEAVLIRAHFDPKRGDKWAEELTTVIKPGIKKLQPQEAELQIELLLLLLDALTTEKVLGVTEPKFTEAAKHLQELLDDPAAMSLDKELRAVLIGKLGLLRFENGRRNEETRDADYQAAGKNLEDALTAGSMTHPRAWVWRRAIAIILMYDANTNKGNKLAAANTTTRAYFHYQAAVRTMLAILDIKNAADPKDRELANEYILEAKARMNFCVEIFQAAFEDATAKESPMAPIWKMAIADAECVKTGRYTPGLTERANLDKAKDQAREGLKQIGTMELKKLATELTDELDSRYKEYK